jgi:hypothetical protein
MDDNAKGVEIKCDICEKTFSARKNLNRHVKEKHSTNIANYECHFCKKNFQSSRELNYHQLRKRGNKKSGCAVDNASDLSSIGSQFGSVVGSVSNQSLNESLISSICSDFLDTASPLEVTIETEMLMGETDVLDIDDNQDFEGLARAIKRKLDSHIAHEKRNTDRYINEVHSEAFLLGACKRVLDMVTYHVKYTCEGVEDLDEILMMRDSLFGLVTVSCDQHDAIHKHKDTARNCSAECNYVKRRVRLHKQQVLLGLSVLETGQVTLEKWKNFVMGHLRDLRLNDVNIGSFIKVLRDNFTGSVGKIVLELESEIRDRSLSDQPPPQSSSAARKNPVNLKQASLQVSVKRLEKGQKTLDRRMMRRKDSSNNVGKTVGKNLQQQASLLVSSSNNFNDVGHTVSEVASEIRDRNLSEEPLPQSSSSVNFQQVSVEKLEKLEKRMKERHVGSY